jgi:hypothetical protein
MNIEEIITGNEKTGGKIETTILEAIIKAYQEGRIALTPKQQVFEADGGIVIYDEPEATSISKKLFEDLGLKYWVDKTGHMIVGAIPIPKKGVNSTSANVLIENLNSTVSKKYSGKKLCPLDHKSCDFLATRYLFLEDGFRYYYSPVAEIPKKGSFGYREWLHENQTPLVVISGRRVVNGGNDFIDPQEMVYEPYVILVTVS